MQIENYTWLIISNPSGINNHPSKQEIEQYIQQHHLELQDPVIVWSGSNLASTWLELLHPQMAIASSNQINPKTRQQLRQKQIKLHNTAEEGMIRWNPQDGFGRQARLLD